MKRCGRLRSYLTGGYSLMAKLQPSKLAMRVRFPLPALNHFCSGYEIVTLFNATCLFWCSDFRAAGARRR